MKNIRMLSILVMLLAVTTVVAREKLEGTITIPLNNTQASTVVTFGKSRSPDIYKLEYVDAAVVSGVTNVTIGTVTFDIERFGNTVQVSEIGGLTTGNELGVDCPKYWSKNVVTGFNVSTNIAEGTDVTESVIENVAQVADFYYFKKMKVTVSQTATNTVPTVYKFTIVGD